MKQIKQFIILLCSCLVLAACDNSLARADRTVGALQTAITTVQNDLTEIRNYESNLQKDFEGDLAQNNLALFNTSDSAVEKNVQARKAIIADLNKQRNTLSELMKELTQLSKRENLPKDQFSTIMGDITALDQDLVIYVNDYSENLALESTSFKSIANPEADYTAFFGVLKNVNTLATTNAINLNKVIPHFEKLNANLVNLKVELVKMQENK